jgi:hypothetical protein
MTSHYLEQPLITLDEARARALTTSHYLDQPVLSLEETRDMLVVRLARGGHTAVRRERLNRMIAQLTVEIAIRVAGAK